MKRRLAAGRSGRGLARCRQNADKHQFDAQPGPDDDEPGFPLEPGRVEFVFRQREHDGTNRAKKKSK